MQDLTIALAQASFRVGDLLTNAQHMVDLAHQARDQGTHLVVFPELALTGYPPEDLILRPSLAARNQEAFEVLKQVTGIVMLFGFVDVTPHGRFNAMALWADGQQKGIYYKQQLPNHSVFDEKRYFIEGQDSVCFYLHGFKLGLLICEDIWQPQPIADLKTLQIDAVLVINASPFATGKHVQRLAVLQQQAMQHQLPIAYVNMVGGQDDLVFDGAAVAVNADGQIALDAPRFNEALAWVHLTAAPTDHTTVTKAAFTVQSTQPSLSLEAETYLALVTGLRDYVNHSGFNGVILGLSGGIDSALSMAIAVDALGAARVHAVMMPYRYTAAISIEDAETQARTLGVSLHVTEINDIMHAFEHTLAPYFAGLPADATEENLQARTRGVLLMALSNKFGQMVLTTGNKSEMAVGYATLYGDMAGGYAVLKDVYKTQVYELARFRNALDTLPVIPERVIVRPPSAELRPDQTDQDSLPAYDELDAILYRYIEQDLSAQDIIAQGFEQEIVHKVLAMVDRNEYKRAQSAIGPRISNRAFGRERRYPLVNGWKIGN